MTLLVAGIDAPLVFFFLSSDILSFTKWYGRGPCIILELKEMDTKSKKS